MIDRDQLDLSVLKAITRAPGQATYVVRNMLAWKNDQWGCGYWPGPVPMGTVRFDPSLICDLEALP